MKVSPARLKAALEVLVLQMWGCVVFALVLRAVAGSAAGVVREPYRLPPPPQCTGGAATDKQCTLAPALITVPTDPSAGEWLVSSARRLPCRIAKGAALTAAQDVRAAAAVAQEACGLEFLGRAPAQEDLCALLARTPCAAYLVGSADVSGCVELLAGPFAASGARLEGEPTKPFLTVLPAVWLSDMLLDVQRVRWLVSGSFLPAASWQGGAFSGTLVLPLAEAPLPILSLRATERLWGSIGAMISSPPRPNPVVADLAGLTACPSPDEVVALAGRLRSLAMYPIGHVEGGADRGAAEISDGGTVVARVYSLRVESKGRTACPTLNTVAPTDVASHIEEWKRFLDEPDVPLAVSLHWTDRRIPDELEIGLIEELLANGVFLVAGFEAAGVARTAVPRSAGIGYLSLGSFLEEGSVLPGAQPAAGLTVQCTMIAPPNAGSPGRGIACTVFPAAQALGETLPVPDLACSECGLLPSGFFPSVFDTGSCLREK